MDEIRRRENAAIICLAGNKLDKEAHRQVSHDVRSRLFTQCFSGLVLTMPFVFVHCRWPSNTPSRTICSFTKCLRRRARMCLTCLLKLVSEWSNPSELVVVCCLFDLALLLVRHAQPSDCHGRPISQDLHQQHQTHLLPAVRKPPSQASYRVFIHFVRDVHEFRCSCGYLRSKSINKYEVPNRKGLLVKV